MTDKLQEPGRDDFLLVIKPHVNEDNKWTGEVSVNIVTSENNKLDDEDYFSMMEFTRLIGASIPVMEVNPRYRALLEKQADKYMPLKKEENMLKVSDVRDNVIEVNFRKE